MPLTKEEVFAAHSDCAEKNKCLILSSDDGHRNFLAQKRSPPSKFLMLQCRQLDYLIAYLNSLIYSSIYFSYIFVTRIKFFWIWLKTDAPANSWNLLQAVPGTKIKDGYNPATWMLEISSSTVEARLDIDFAEVYAYSTLYQWVINKNMETFWGVVCVCVFSCLPWCLMSLCQLYPWFSFFFVLFRRNQELINEPRTPAPGSKDLHFPTNIPNPL